MTELLSQHFTEEALNEEAKLLLTERILKMLKESYILSVRVIIGAFLFRIIE